VRCAGGGISMFRKIGKVSSNFNSDMKIICPDPKTGRSKRIEVQLSNDGTSVVTVATKDMKERILEQHLVEPKKSVGMKPRPGVKYVLMQWSGQKQCKFSYEINEV
jgi:hypothetical protein